MLNVKDVTNVWIHKVEVITVAIHRIKHHLRVVFHLNSTYFNHLLFVKRTS